MLIRCQDCGRQVSSTAESCPHCGNTKFLEQYKEKIHDFELRQQYREKEAKKLGYSSYKEKIQAEKTQRERFKRIEKITTIIVVCIASLIFILYLYFQQS